MASDLASARNGTRKLALTLILSLNIVLSVRSTEGRSHEASCGWDRMRRPRACCPHSTHPGGPGPRPAVNTSRLPGARLTDGRHGSPANEKRGPGRKEEHRK